MLEKTRKNSCAKVDRTEAEQSPPITEEGLNALRIELRREFAPEYAHIKQIADQETTPEQLKQDWTEMRIRIRRSSKESNK